MSRTPALPVPTAAFPFSVGRHHQPAQGAQRRPQVARRRNGGQPFTGRRGAPALLLLHASLSSHANRPPRGTELFVLNSDAAGYNPRRKCGTCRRRQRRWPQKMPPARRRIRPSRRTRSCDAKYNGGRCAHCARVRAALGSQRLFSVSPLFCLKQLKAELEAEMDANRQSQMKEAEDHAAEHQEVLACLGL